MPQLDKVSFLSQYFWLCVFYVGLYYILLKYFLPRLSRILLVRRKKINLSQQGVGGLQQENQQLRETFEKTLSNALGVSRTRFQKFFSRTTGWVDDSVVAVNKTQYHPINKTYIANIGSTSLSQNLLLYYATPHFPQKFAVGILVEKMKHLQPRQKNSKKK